jgi:NDP-sugar pyrophosphorylase family protein
MINTAFYLFSPEIYKVMREMGNEARDIGGDLIPYLTENGYPVYGYPITGYWIDIGTPERLLLASMNVLASKVRHFSFRHQYKPNQWIHPTTLSRIKRHLDSGDIKLLGNVAIGRNCRIEPGVVIENSHIGHTCMIERGAEVKNSMLMSFSNLMHGAVMERAIVGRHSSIGAHSTLASNQSNGMAGIPVIGENVVLPKDSSVGPGLRVAQLKYSHMILATGKFLERGSDERNIYFSQK